RWIVQSQPTRTGKIPPESHHRQVVDRSSPTCSLNNGKQRSGLNDPPPAGGGILEDSYVFCRSGLNDPPPAGGGIPESPNLCRYRCHIPRGLASFVSTQDWD